MSDIIKSGAAICAVHDTALEMRLFQVGALSER